jgi:hypothetical protein
VEEEASVLAELAARYADLITLHHLSASDDPGVLVDGRGEALSRLGVRDAHGAAQYLVWPDGHIGFRCAGRDVGAVAEYLGRWFEDRVARQARSRSG